MKKKKIKEKAMTNEELFGKDKSTLLMKTYELGMNEAWVNVGSSDYHKHFIQPWHIWQDYNLNAFDADIVKRVLRTKGHTEQEKWQNRIDDYKKIIHICRERIRQLAVEQVNKKDK